MKTYCIYDLLLTAHCTSFHVIAVAYFSLYTAQNEKLYIMSMLYSTSDIFNSMGIINIDININNTLFTLPSILSVFITDVYTKIININ